MQQTPSINWRLESTRVTMFSDDAFNSRSLETWLETIGENPPIHVNKTPTSFLGVSRSHNGLIQAVWNDKRLDLTLIPEKADALPYIAPFEEAKQLFASFVEAAPRIKDLPPVNRIALGLVLTAPIETDKQAIDLLKTVIHSLQVDSGVRDLLYRANYPSQSHSKEGLAINRLATWSGGQVQALQLRIRAANSQIEEATTLAPTYAIRLELDINTDQSETLHADPDLVLRLLSELRKIAANIANNGEPSIES